MKVKPEDLEKYSSAVTLSDMEVFVFPELFYALILANIMSPIVWKWRNLSCFKKLEGKDSYKKLLRLRQFIMDEYDFNLDLETWGLTSKAKELKRFEKFISPEDIAKSNGLFGYEGDKYYFDVDIRKHFGLDKYGDEVIPYWKTETVEAMDAFLRKPGYAKKAGECVSLSTLYAAAAFIVCGIPLKDIYAVLTPLHSQNFIDIRDGVLTNNRRLVTKAMWFNGTAVSYKAQRALRHENVTIISHSTGYVHCFYKQATIKPETYSRFTNQLGSYLSTGLSVVIFANFLRSNRDYQKYFQLCRDCRGHPQFIKAETLFHYEHGSDFRIADNTHEKLLEEVSDEDFVAYEIPGRIRCDSLCEFITENKIDPGKKQGRHALAQFLQPVMPMARQFVEELADFVHTDPKLPSPDKEYVPAPEIEIGIDWTRQRIIDYLQKLRANSDTADLAFYAYRDMETCDWTPFIKAAVERCPVSLAMANDKSVDEVYAWLREIGNDSIYDDNRLAQPDEVANYHTGDGLEKAFVLADVIRGKSPRQNIEISVNDNEVILMTAAEYRFASSKGLKKNVAISSSGDIAVSG
ncbi:MAG: hypothetical protein JW749_05515 [Sedimentisphaerales bacterium]|nr:hypothetical protein [Sedimentisphaerales bacterium]